jgi:hypothetical protein
LLKKEYLNEEKEQKKKRKKKKTCGAAPLGRKQEVEEELKRTRREL